MSDSTATNPITGANSLGEFDFSYSINTETYEITVSTAFDGLDCGTSTLSETHMQGTIFKNTGIQIYEGKVTADFQNSKLEATVEINSFGKVVYQNYGTIARW